ncbi:hypothetical protein LC593_36730 [Nostoc sp. CHAB 5844]|nr:hypothetical protein [Nostoc sp. CHAB 5844]
MLDLLKIPLLLSITILTYQESTSTKDKDKLNSNQYSSHELLQSYVKLMLERKINSNVYTEHELPPSEQTLKYLIFLALMLKQNSQTEFLIENIKGSWLQNEVDIFTYKVCSIISFGVFLFILFSTVFSVVLDTYKGLIFGLFFGLYWCLIFGLVLKIDEDLKSKFNFQHFYLRLILYFRGYIPWNYARFLDYCTERMLLQRVGGRYRFIHKLLQDHFAQMEFRRD